MLAIHENKRSDICSLKIVNLFISNINRVQKYFDLTLVLTIYLLAQSCDRLRRLSSMQYTPISVMRTNIMTRQIVSITHHHVSGALGFGFGFGGSGFSLHSGALLAEFKMYMYSMARTLCEVISVVISICGQKYV